MAGRSLMPVIEGGRESIREATITGYCRSADRAVRDRQYSFVLRPEGEPDELYDLAADPRECSNIIGEKPEVADELAARFPSIYYPEPPRSHGVQGDSEVAHTPIG